MKALVRNGICRDCYKRLYNIKLRTKEFKCDFYKSTCPVCKEERHLVADLKWNVHFKLAFKRTPNFENNGKRDYIIGEDGQRSEE